jgi:nucleoid-associated protein YgaU
MVAVVSPRLHEARRAPASPAVRQRRRQAAVVFSLILAASVVWALVGVAGRLGNGPLAVPGSDPAVVPIATVSHIVQPGDTLWSIARAWQPNGDVRAVVDRLSAEVHGQPLRVGERLVLP